MINKRQIITFLFSLFLLAGVAQAQSCVDAIYDEYAYLRYGCSDYGGCDWGSAQRCVPVDLAGDWVEESEAVGWACYLDTDYCADPICEPIGACGSAGGCPNSNEMCTFVGGMGGYEQCVVNEDECAPAEVCDESRAGQCGTAGGCANPEDQCVCSGSSCACQPDLCAEVTCDGAHVGECGSDGGCSSISYMCTDQGTGVFTCVYNSECEADDEVCGAPETSGQCNEDGNCPTGYRCNAESGICETDSSCEPDVLLCSPVCLDYNCPDSTCGVSAGCEVGSRCVSPGGTDPAECIPDSNCPEDSSEIEPIPYEGPVVDFVDLLGRLYLVLFTVGIVLGLIFIIKSGYGMMTSEGNPEKLAAAKEDLTSTVLGIVFVLLSAVILRLVVLALFG